MAGKGAVFEKACATLRSLIHSGKEQRGTLDFLGRHIVQDKDFTIQVDQYDYVRQIKPIYILAARPRIPSDSLTGTEPSSYLSLVQQLAWPIRRTALVRHGYLVSDLQQRTSKATVAVCRPG